MTRVPKGNSARRANEVTLDWSFRGKETWTATNRDADVVCLVELNGTFSVSSFNNLSEEKKYAMTGDKRRNFMFTQATTEGGLFGVSEKVVLIFIVSRDASTLTLHLGDSPPIKFDLGSKIAEKIEFSE